MSEVFSGDGLQWVTIFIIVLCFLMSDKVRGAWGKIMNDEHKILQSQLQKLEQKIDSIEDGLTELRNRDK